MKKAVVGILAHVDAGKTTLAEAILVQAGKRKTPGRVDHGDTLLDTHALERERGITIFASQAVFSYENVDYTLLDTPGHVDFSAETERMLRVLDAAVLVISGSDGVQAHTLTLWRLLRLYQIPTFLFITKMDLCRRAQDELMEELRRELGEGCVDLTDPDCGEALAMCREDLLERYLETGEIADADVRELVAQRLVFPCCFGSGLRRDGVEGFLHTLSRYVPVPEYPGAFGARVFKISHDPQGTRLTHIKVTGGILRVRDPVEVDGVGEKCAQLRLYTGEKYTAVDAVEAGGVCAVAGWEHSRGGMGLGVEAERHSIKPALEPVMHYRIRLPQGCDPKVMLPKLRQLEEEDPQLHLRWDAQIGEIHVGLMGQVQAEILQSLIRERFGVEAEIDAGRVLYKETVRNTVEGVGHYEPLRHYAEVHLLLEPRPLCSGILLESRCAPDTLDHSWQQLILTHLAEKTHLGVLTGSPITDVKITLMSGRAHLKHTEGGDFRQATYRALRQGLMQAESALLEPVYRFRLEIPTAQIGRAITDIRARHGECEDPRNLGERTVLEGIAPVTTMNDYAQEVAAYTGGRGRLNLQVEGYRPCHNPDMVREAFDYDPEADLENTPDSVFCAHGGGFTVKWNEVPRYMHLESCCKPRQTAAPAPRYRSLDDAELEAIMNREFGPIKRPQYSMPAAGGSTYETRHPTPRRPKYLVVDGYNVIFAWDDLSRMAEGDLSMARDALLDKMAGYCAYTGCDVTVVFDGYRLPGNMGEKFDFHKVHVVYTKENETGDMYIEKCVSGMGRNTQVRVVSNDGLIQLTTIRSGVLRMTAAEFARELSSVSGEIRRMLDALHKGDMGSVGENLLAQQKKEK